MVPCNAPAGAVVPPKRGRTGQRITRVRRPDRWPKSLIEADSSLIRNQYLEVRLPDSSIACARQQPMRPGSFVTVIHVVPTAGGWPVDRWEASGC
ncbi:MAG: hypothetical protein ACR2KK_21700 [Acidimicrobiales bacterium]